MAEPTEIERELAETAAYLREHPEAAVAAIGAMTQGNHDRKVAERLELEFVQTNKGVEDTWQRSKLRGSPIVKLKDYDVFAMIGDERVQLGRVYQELHTFERSSRGRTYVNSRWRSPRWFCAVKGSHCGRLDYTTRKAAAGALVDGWKSWQQRQLEIARG